MPTIRLANEIEALDDLAPKWRWAVLLPTLPIGPSSLAPTDTKFSSFPEPYEGLLPVSDIPYLLAHRVEFSTQQIAVDQRQKMHAQINYPRGTVVGNVAISFYEDSDYSVMRYIKSWQNRIVDNNRNYGVPKDYKRNIVVWMFDIRSNDAPRAQQTFIDCWPPSAGQLSYSYDESGLVIVTVDFACDDERTEFIAGGRINNGGSVPFIA